MLSKMPEDFQERVYREQVSKLSGPPALNAKGFSAPLNIFLYQVSIHQCQRESWPYDTSDIIKGKARPCSRATVTGNTKNVYSRALAPRTFGVCFFMFSLPQEVQRMQRILSIVRTNLSSIISAIDGTVIMTPDLQVGRGFSQETHTRMQSTTIPC